MAPETDRNDDENTPLLRSSETDKSRKGTVLSSIAILMSSCVGAGTLSVAYGFSRGGLLFAMIVFLVIITIAVVAAMQILDGKDMADDLYNREISAVKVDNLVGLGEAAFGIIGKVFSIVVIATLLFLSVIAYMIFSRDQLEKVLYYFVQLGTEEGCVTHSVFVSHPFATTIIFIPLFPLFLLRNLTPLKFTSALSIICILFLALAVVVKFGMRLANLSDPWPREGSKVHLWPHPVGQDSALNNVITCFNYLSLTMVCQFNILPLQRELRKPTRLRLGLVNVITLLLALMIYVVVGIFGYLTFLDTTPADITVGYASSDILMTIGRLLLIIAISLNSPVIMHPVRESINSLLYMFCKFTLRCSSKSKVLNEEIEKSSTTGVEHLYTSSAGCRQSKKFYYTAWFCETTVLFGSAFIAACFIPQVSTVWNFVSACGGILVLYVMPPLFYLRIQHKHLRSVENAVISIKLVVKIVIALIVLAAGIITMVTAIYNTVIGLTKPQISTAAANCVYDKMINSTHNATAFS